MDYEKMVKDAIRDATGPFDAAHDYVDEIYNHIRQAMNDNMVVFYEP